MTANDATVVLAHGAWADGSSWAKVIMALAASGVKAVAAPLPLTSFQDDVAALDRTLERVEGPVVLAGHAYAGAVIGATRSEKVKALVYVAALAPDEGETVADVFSCISVAGERPLWKDRPAWFLVAEQDRMIAPQTQRFMAERMKARTRAHLVDHTPLVTAPPFVLDIIREAVAYVAG